MRHTTIAALLALCLAGCSIEQRLRICPAPR